MKRTDITRLGRDREDGLDIFSVEGVRLNTPRLSIPDDDDANDSAPEGGATGPEAGSAAAQGAAAAAPGAAAAAPADGAGAQEGGAAAQDDGAGALEGGADAPGDGAAGVTAAAAALDVAGPSGTSRASAAAGEAPDVTIQTRSRSYAWRSQMRRNPITGEGMETEEYTAAGQKKTFRDC